MLTFSSQEPRFLNFPKEVQSLTYKSNRKNVKTNILKPLIFEISMQAASDSEAFIVKIVIPVPTTAAPSLK